MTKPPRGRHKVLFKLVGEDRIPDLTVLRNREHGDITVRILLPKELELLNLESNYISEGDRIEVILETFPPGQP